MRKNLKPENEVEYYYDSHPLPEEEDLVGVSAFHADLARYLVLVLRWLFREQRCAIHENLNFYQTRDPHERPVAPDIAVIKGVDYQPVRSWTIGWTGPAPQVVFEIASKETWRADVHEKSLKYALLGVREYFFYDPNDPPFSPPAQSLLRGWRLNPVRGVMEELQGDSEGRLWSQYLESFLVPDGLFLRLYDTNLQQRLTGEEAAVQERELALQRAEALAQEKDAAMQRAEVLAQEKDAAMQRAEALVQEKDAAMQRAEVLVQEKEALTQEREALIQKLRSLGINPDEI